MYLVCICPTRGAERALCSMRVCGNTNPLARVKEGQSSALYTGLVRWDTSGEFVLKLVFVKTVSRFYSEKIVTLLPSPAPPPPAQKHLPSTK